MQLQLKTGESQLWPSVSTSTLEKNCDVFNEVSMYAHSIDSMQYIWFKRDIIIPCCVRR